jgi:hypothetical protein
MPAGIGAAGYLGVAFETTPGTYVAPTKFIPIRSEGLQLSKAINYTRPIIKTAVEPVHAVAGPSHIEGDIEWEVIEDCLVYFLYASRMTVVKSGTTPNFVYTFTPAATAQEANETLSITVIRNEEVFGYTGVVVGGMSFTVDNGLLVSTMRMLGRNEADQATPSPTFPQTVPFGADTYVIEIPAASPITDAGSFTFDVDDSAEAQFRLGSLAAQYIGYGERNVSVEIERDFIDKTQYDLFKALTAQSIHLRAAKNANRFVDFLVHAGVMDSYETMLEGQGEIITAALNFTGKYDFTETNSFEMAVGTAEDIT